MHRPEAGGGHALETQPRWRSGLQESLGPIRWRGVAEVGVALSEPCPAPRGREGEHSVAQSGPASRHQGRGSAVSSQPPWALLPGARPSPSPPVRVPLPPRLCRSHQHPSQKPRDGLAPSRPSCGVWSLRVRAAWRLHVTWRGPSPPPTAVNPGTGGLFLWAHVSGGSVEYAAVPLCILAALGLTPRALLCPVSGPAPPAVLAPGSRPSW